MPQSRLEKSAADVRCPRCGALLHQRKPDSLQRSLALLIAAAVLYVPAKDLLLPVWMSGGGGISGTAATAQGNQSSAASGTETVSGSAALAQGSQSATGAGIHSQPATGTAATGTAIATAATGTAIGIVATGTATGIVATGLRTGPADRAQSTVPTTTEAWPLRAWRPWR